MNQRRIKRYACALAVFATLTLVNQPLAAQQAPDLILHNGKVLTVDANFTIAQAIAIQGDRIAAVGSNAQILGMAGPNTRRIDLKGRSVMPGIIDTHNHIHDYAENAYGGEIGPNGLLAYPIDWSAVTTVDDVLSQVRGHLEKYKIPPGTWVYFANTGTGGDAQSKVMFDDLTRWELDKVAPDNPIAMALAFPNVNGLVINSKAFDIVWNKHQDFIKKYGRYWIDSNGTPDGHFEVPAVRLILGELPEPPPERVAPLYKKYAEELVAQGVTTLSTRLQKYATAAFQQLDASGELPLRMAYGMETFFGRMTNLQGGLKSVAAQIGQGTDMVWAVAAGISALDGASTRSCTSQSRAAALSVLDKWWPTGQCLMDTEYRGAKGAPIHANYIQEWLAESARDGVRMANTHITGDRTVKMLLNQIEAFQKQYGPNSTKNWAMDHCYLVDPADLPRAARLGVQFSCYIRMNGIAAIAKSLGDKVANTFSGPVKSMMDAGITVAYEADSDRSIWQDLEDTMVRKDSRGRVWGPQERLNHEEVLRFFTSMGSRYVLRENKIGTLEPGKFADLTILDRDFMATAPEDMGSVQPQMTLTGGRIVYIHPDFAQENNLSANGAVVSTLADLKKRRKRLGISRR